MNRLQKPYLVVSVVCELLQVMHRHHRIDTYDDNLRLKPGSPCINAGDNAVLPLDKLDLDSDGDPNEPIPFDIEGKPRILNGRVDIGAYESG